MIARLAFASWMAVSSVAVLISATALSNGPMRYALLVAAYRKISLVMPPKYAFAGDSLTAQCGWRRAIAKNPLALVNLANGGAVLRQIADQVSQANAMRAEFIMIEGGGNDILVDDAPISQMERDFKWLLHQVGDEQKAIVTLIPYISNPAYTVKFAQANRSISEMARGRGYPIIDLNEQISADGVRRPEMTADGLHFTDLSCSIWIDAIQQHLAQLR